MTDEEFRQRQLHMLTGGSGVYLHCRRMTLWERLVCWLSALLQQPQRQHHECLGWREACARLAKKRREQKEPT